MPSEWDLVQVELRRLGTAIGLRPGELKLSRKDDLSGKLIGVLMTVRDWTVLRPVDEIRSLMASVNSAEVLEEACRERGWIEDPDG